MSLFISDEEKNAFHSAVKGVLSGVPIEERLSTLESIVNACYQVHYSGDKKIYTKPHIAAFKHAVAEWLEGNDPYGVDLTVKLSKTAKKEVERLLKVTRMTSFSASQEIGLDLFETNCALSMGQWKGRVNHSYSYDREYYNSIVIYTDPPLETPVHSWDQLRAAVNCSLSTKIFQAYFFLAVFDFMHAGLADYYQKRPIGLKDAALFYPI